MAGTARKGGAPAKNEKQLPAEVDYGEYEGLGYEDQTGDDVAVPFIVLMQSNSPEVNDGVMKAGQFFNRTTGEIFEKDQGFAFVPSYTRHTYVEWVPLDDGGGYVGEHEVESEVVAHCKANQPLGKYKLSNGNELIETFYVFGVQVDEAGNPQPLVLAFSSTGIGVYKKWMFRARSIMVSGPGGRRMKAPLFAHRWRFTSVPAAKKTYKWQQWKIDFDGTEAADCRLSPDSPIFREAHGVYMSVKEGSLRADVEKSRDGGGPDEGGHAPDPDAQADQAPFE